MKTATKGRPRGAEREAIERAVLAMDDACGGTWRELANASLVGYATARHVVENMARSGDLAPIGATKLAGGQWATLYVAAGSLAMRESGGAAAELQEIVNTRCLT